MDPDGKPIGRRVVLGIMALGVAGIFGGRRVQTIYENILAPIQTRDPTGLSSLVPDGGGFRFYSIVSRTPRVPVENYRLTISGLVDKPTVLTYADLEAMPQTSMTKDFQCVTGWRVRDVPWSGVLLPDLLDAVGVKPSATAVTFKSFDGAYTESLTMEQARRRDVLVATHMLGGTVSQQHGGPVRLYVAPMYGYKSLKWLSEIAVVDRLQPGYWERNGYDIDAYVGKSNGRDDAATV